MARSWHDLDRLWGSMELLHNRMNGIIDDLDQSWLLWSGEMERNYPWTNLYDDGDHFRLEAEVPGFNRKDLKIRLEGNYLELSGSRELQTPAGYKLHLRERQAAGFSRSFTLPAEIAHDRVEAELKNGILSLKLPKAEAARPRQIEIN